MQSGKPEEDPFLMELLNSAVGDDDPMTTEELRYSTPYSERETWAQMIMGELLIGRQLGTSHLKGPPGFWAEIESLLASTTLQEMRERFLEGSRLTACEPPPRHRDDG